MEYLGIDVQKVHQCYGQSFSDLHDEQSSNAMLAKDTKKESDLGIYMHPSLTINDMSYRGYLEGMDVFEAICSSFKSMPPICKDLLNMTQDKD